MNTQIITWQLLCRRTEFHWVRCSPRGSRPRRSPPLDNPPTPDRSVRHGLQERMCRQP